MTTASLRDLRSPRVLFVTVALALASTSAASADVLTPLEATDGPGGSMMIEELGLVPTNNGGGFATLEDGAATASYEDLLALSGGADASTITGVAPAEMPIAGLATDEAPVLVGSGPERETVAQADEPAFVAQSQNADSIARHESLYAEDGALATGADAVVIASVEQAKAAAAEEAAGWPEFDSIAIGQQALASVEQAPQATSPYQMNF